VFSPNKNELTRTIITYAKCNIYGKSNVCVYILDLDREYCADCLGLLLRFWRLLTISNIPIFLQSSFESLGNSPFLMFFVER